MSPLGCEYPNSISIKYYAHILVSYFRIYVYLPLTLGYGATFVNPFGLRIILPIGQTMEVAEDIVGILLTAWTPVAELNLFLCMIFLWSVTSPPSKNFDDNVTIW